MRLILAGGTGFIGRALRESLVREGHEVLILTRQSSLENQPGVRTRYRFWNPPEGGTWESELEGMEGVINLAGEPVVGKRWSREQKEKILDSRLNTTRALVEAMKKTKKKPFFLLNASATGYYGPREDETLTEETAGGDDFLAQTCRLWEEEAYRAENLGIRVVCLRIGIVLEKDGGALGKMLLPFQLGLGGPLGTGRQWMSWIHREDLIGLIHLILEKKEIRGAVNGTAPRPVRMKEFAKTLGSTLHRPAFFPVPGFGLKILLGEMADILLTGQRVEPARALGAGYPFKFSELETALKEILRK